MHNRHWVARNRGKNLEYVIILEKTSFNVNCYLKLASSTQNSLYVNVNAQPGRDDF